MVAWHRAQHLLDNRQEPHLEDELHAGLGEDGEGAEHPGPGQRLELEEVLLPPADHDQVPHHQAHLQPTIGSSHTANIATHREQDRAEEHAPEDPLSSSHISVQQRVGVAQNLWGLQDNQIQSKR